METKVLYRNGKEETIILHGNDVKTVKEYKHDLANELKILAEFIVLTNDNMNLEDNKSFTDYEITENSVIKMTIEVMVQEIDKTSNVHNKCHNFFMEYDATIDNLKIKICETLHKTNIKITNKGVCEDNIYIREYLTSPNGGFVVSELSTVTIISESGNAFEIEVYLNDVVEVLSTALVNKGILSNIYAPLMIGDKLLWNKSELNVYRQSDPFLIYVGFFVSIIKGDQSLIKSCVNFNTKLSHLKPELSKKFGLELNLISFMIGSNNVDDDQTIGFYQLKEGDRLELIENLKILIFFVNEERLTEQIVKIGDTIGDMKEELALKCGGVGAESIVLLLDETELDNECVVKSLDFDERTILHMTISDSVAEKMEGEGGIMIIVRQSDEDVEQYDVKWNSTLSELKEILREKYNTSVDYLKLRLNEHDVPDDLAISELGVVNGSTLTLLIDEHLGREIDVIVKNGLGSDTKNAVVRDDDSVDYLRNQLTTLFNLTTTDYVVSFRGEIMKNESLIGTYGINDGDQIVMSHSLFVNYFSGGVDNCVKIQRFPFLNGDKVEDLEVEIKKMLSLEESSMYLSFNGSVLEKNMTLEECDVENESVLMMTVAGVE